MTTWVKPKISQNGVLIKSMRYTKKLYFNFFIYIFFDIYIIFYIYIYKEKNKAHIYHVISM